MAGQVSINDQSFNAAVAINKYQAVVLDTSTAHQVTLPGATANGKNFIGIAQEDVDPTSYDPMLNVRVDGISFALAAGAIGVGDAVVLSATAGSLESVPGNTVGAPNVVGYALTAAAAAGDQFLLRIVAQPSLEPFKKISGTTNATAGTQNSYAHGLGYIPTDVVLTSKSNGNVYMSAAADATNIYVSGSAASLNFDAYVR